MPSAFFFRKYLCLLTALLACKGEISHSFTGSWAALPAELQGEVQGLPAHWAIQGQGGAASTANALATHAAVEIMKTGGNAIDALLAAQWVLAVVEPQSSGLGGGGFLLYYETKSRKVYAFDAREEFPEHADENLFLGADGKPLPFPERIKGARAIGVPGTVALMEYAQRRFGSGKITFADTLARARHLARHGIRVSPRLAQAMTLNGERLIRQNGESSPYLKSGSPYAVGEVLYQHDLAGTLALLADGGARAFYSGNISSDIIATVKNNHDYSSRMTPADLAQYRVVERQPVSQPAGGFQLYSVGAPASGGAVLASLRSLAANPSSAAAFFAPLLAAEKTAFAEREKTLEDPDFAFAKASMIRRAPGEGKAADRVSEAENTTHVSIADSVGNIVSYTSSVETSMGSALVVRGRGFLLNNQLSDFAAETGKVNSPEKGRRDRVTALNSEAKETRGGKRPKSSMSPLILMKGDGSYFSLGSPGGPTIVGTNAAVAGRLIAGEELQEAILKPRILMMPNGKALVEVPLKRDAAFLAAIGQRGIDVDLRRNIISLGSVQAVGYDARKKIYTAASDLRREGLGMVVVPVLD